MNWKRESMPLHDVIGVSGLAQLKQDFDAWNPACVKPDLRYLQESQEVSSSDVDFWGGWSAVPGVIGVPLEKILYRQVMKYSPEFPVNPWKCP